MQPSAASKRLLRTLSSKIHPQLPLSPRESQQLLNLLTTSFRAHLDIEHPAPVTAAPTALKLSNLSNSHGPRSSSPNRASASSYNAATQHLDSILSNPLFAVKPRRRASDSAVASILRDPLSWFVNEIASGTATLSKAASCLAALARAPKHEAAQPIEVKGSTTVFSDWLRTSGSDTSKQFITMCVSQSGMPRHFLYNLVSRLVLEDNTAALWRWYIRSNEARVSETGLEAAHVSAFKQHLLASMVIAESKISLDKGIATFLQAYRMSESLGYESAYRVLRASGGYIVNRIVNGAMGSDPMLYQSFLASTESWLGNWSQVVRPMLWLHHPTQSSPLPALQFIKDREGAAAFVNMSTNRQLFIVRLCLATARQLIAEKQYTDAIIPMEFTKQYFPHIISTETAPAAERAAPSLPRRQSRSEQENLGLLDGLVPT